MVLPGLPLVLASFLNPVREFIKDDFPTFDLPMNAYSGMLGSGHFVNVVELIMKFAYLIFMIILFAA